MCLNRISKIFQSLQLSLYQSLIVKPPPAIFHSLFRELIKIIKPQLLLKTNPQSEFTFQPTAQTKQLFCRCWLVACRLSRSPRLSVSLFVDIETRSRIIKMPSKQVVGRMIKLSLYFDSSDVGCAGERRMPMSCGVVT